MNKYRVAFFFLFVWFVWLGWGSCQGVLGAGIRWVVQARTGGQFVYRDLCWEDGRAVFLDIDFRWGEFRVQAPRVEAAFSWEKSPLFLGVSVCVEKPYAFLGFGLGGGEGIWSEYLPESSSWVDWKLTCRDGLLHWPAAGIEAKMTLEKRAPWHIGNLKLESDASYLEVEALREENGARAEIRLTQCDLLFFQPYLKGMGLDARFKGGKVDGSIHLEAFASEAPRGRGHVKIQEAALEAYGMEFGAESALLDWDGVLQGAADRLRFECVKGEWRAGLLGFEEIDILLSYHSDMGVKGEVRALGRHCEDTSPLTLSSKGFWSSFSEPWLKTDSMIGEASCSVDGDFTHWTIHLERLQPFWGRFAQELLMHSSLGQIPWLEEKKEIFWNAYPGLKDVLSEWEWREGAVTALFHVDAGQIRSEMFRAEKIKIYQKETEGIFLGWDQVFVQNGQFSLQGFYGKKPLISGYSLLASDWRADGGFSRSEWKGGLKISKDERPDESFMASSFSLDHLGKWFVRGQCGEYPFSLGASFENNIWSFAFEGGAHLFTPEISLDAMAATWTLGPKYWSLDAAHAEMRWGEEKVHIRAFECTKREDEISFDIRASQGFLDLVRVVGKEKGGILSLDSEKTEMLGGRIRTNPWNWKESLSFAASLELPWSNLLALEPMCQAAGFSFPDSFKRPLSGSLFFQFFFLPEKACSLSVKGSPLFWDNQPLLWTLQLDREDQRWRALLENKDPQHLGSFAFAFSRDFGSWSLEEGSGNFPDQMTCRFSGQCDQKGKGQVLFSECFVSSSFVAPFPFEGNLEGKGVLSFDLGSSFYEVDGDLSKIHLTSGRWRAKNKKPVHAFFSPERGLMLQGLDGQINLDKEMAGECQIKLLHWEPEQSNWLFAQMHLHLLEGAGALLFQKDWIPHQEMDLIADGECSSDFSTFSCRMKEGFLPLQGRFHHVQNAHIQVNGTKIDGDLQYVHQGHEIKIDFEAHLGEVTSGRLVLEELIDETKSEEPLTLVWEYEEEKGLSLHSIQGNFAGVQASFCLQELDATAHLIGSAKIDFSELSTFLPPSVADVFTELEMGRGYEIKGKLQIERKDPTNLFFQGLLSGKNVEFLGYEFQTCLAKLDVAPNEIQIKDFKFSDPAGFFHFDQLTMKGDQTAPWRFNIPLISITEFRPSLLKTARGERGEISPLVIRTMTFRNLQGLLEDRTTYTAQGELSFINSYKRERTIFDIPSEVLGRIIGLDMELLIPVCGKLSYELQEGKIRIDALKEAYSQGRRSQFFLVPTPDGPSVDLDGHLQIEVKMKQYVLFKLTEAFSISIDGTLKKPEYHLQKNKSR